MMALPLLGLTCEPRLVSPASRYYSTPEQVVKLYYEPARGGQTPPGSGRAPETNEFI